MHFPTREVCDLCPNLSFKFENVYCWLCLGLQYYRWFRSLYQHWLLQGGFDGRGQPTASPMLTAIMSGGVGISGRELYKYR